MEIAKAVVPHAAPHVARAVVDAAKDRRAADAARADVSLQPTNQNIADALTYLEQRLSSADEKAAVAEQKLSLAEARMADRWATARKWAIVLLVWNTLTTAALIVLITLLARR
ncbi:MAG TPA: hypothetical protein VIX19_04650 [Terriglobales bacterium]